MKRDAAYWSGLVRELASLPRETGWLEFKHNKADPQEIGENISALANSAALEGKAQAYIVWGVADDSHAVVGTTFDPAQVRRGNEELESWLLRSLAPKIEFRFQHVDVDGVRVVVLVVARAMRTPVQFLGTDYVRIGSQGGAGDCLPGRQPYNDLAGARRWAGLCIRFRRADRLRQWLVAQQRGDWPGFAA